MVIDVRTVNIQGGELARTRGDFLVDMCVLVGIQVTISVHLSKLIKLDT